MISSLKGPTSVVGLFFVLLLVGCATYQGKVEKSRLDLIAGDHAGALKQLKSLAEVANGDQLVYLLDYATALQISGEYLESNKVFLKADRLSENVDYHSVTNIAGSLALNQEMVQYKGDTFEKIFINAYLAMNFLELGDLDDALVEARRINEKYLKNRADEKKTFELNSFSKYLSAVIWEANRSYDDAYIAYAEAYKIDPSIATIKVDLIRSAKLARRMDSYASWKKKFPEVQENPDWYDRSKGELIIIYQQGWGPRKGPAPGEYRLPSLYPVKSTTQSVNLLITNDNSVYPSRRIYNVEAAAIATLSEDYGILLAKRLAGVATKAVLADQVRQNNKALGDLAWIAMNIADRADLRQWSLLPQTIQIIRLPMKPGKYNIDLQGLTGSGTPSGENSGVREVEIKAQSKKFVIWRSLK